MVTHSDSDKSQGGSAQQLLSRVALEGPLLVPYIFRVVLLRPQHIRLHARQRASARVTFFAAVHLLAPVIRLRYDPDGGLQRLVTCRD